MKEAAQLIEPIGYRTAGREGRMDNEWLVYQRVDRSAFYAKPFQKTEERGERVIAVCFHETDAEYICKAVEKLEPNNV